MNSIKMDFTNMIIKDFIDYIITFDNIMDILDTCKTPQDKGFIFERLFDIVIKFGFCDVFTNGNYKHLTGNANNAKLKVLQMFNQFLNEMVISSNSGGKSDITLQNKNDNKYIFISSKYYSSSTSVQDYDIQDIIAIVVKHKHIYKDHDIYLTVKDKKKFLKYLFNMKKIESIKKNYIILKKNKIKI
jgi:hypothetical protein